MITAWTSSRSTMSSHRVDVMEAPVCWRAAASVAGLVSHSAVTLTSGHNARPGRWFCSAMPPQPMMAKFKVLMDDWSTTGGEYAQAIRNGKRRGGGREAHDT